MPPALDKRVETPTHRSRRTHQRTGAGEQKCPIPAAHMAFIATARIAFVGTIACLVAAFTAFIAFTAAARIAFVGTIACLVAAFTTFIAFIGAGAAAFAFRMAFVATNACAFAVLLTAFAEPDHPLPGANH